MVENVKYSKSGMRQEGVRNVQASGTSRCQEHPDQESPIISPRLRAATHVRSAALGGFAPSQARPQQAPLVGAALVVVETSVAV